VSDAGTSTTHDTVLSSMKKCSILLALTALGGCPAKPSPLVDDSGAPLAPPMGMRLIDAMELHSQCLLSGV
jgi:hypothetical protein